MKNASRSSLVLFVVALLISAQTFAQSRPGRDRDNRPVPPQRDHRRDDHRPLPPAPRERQVLAYSLITIQVNQMIRQSGVIPLKALVKQQYGLTLEGAQIDRVVVLGSSLGRFSHPASVQVLLNGYSVGPEKYLDGRNLRTPLRVQSYEEVQGTLQLQVRGDARIDQINIRVGSVRPLRHW
jgi:hypothetical protein